MVMMLLTRASQTEKIFNKSELQQGTRKFYCEYPVGVYEDGKMSLAVLDTNMNGVC